MLNHSIYSLTIFSILLSTGFVGHAQAPEIEWQNTIGGSSTDELHCLQQTNDGGYIVGGYSGSNIFADKTEPNIGLFDYWIVKLNTLGGIEWQNTIGGDDWDYLNCIKVTPDKGFIVGGYSESGISGDKTEANIGGDDYWIVKLDSLGNLEWQNTIGGDDDDKLRSVILSQDGGYVLCGYSKSGISGDKTEANIGGDDYWIVKLDSLGNIDWQNTIGGAELDNAYCIEQTPDGGFVIGGFSSSGISGDKTEESIESAIGLNTIDYWVVKLNSSGNLEWQNTIGGNGSDYLQSINLTEDGGFILGGFSKSGFSADKTENNLGGNDYWILKLTSFGEIVWQNTIGGVDDDNLYSIEQTVDGGFILGGYSGSDISGDKSENTIGGGEEDFWIVKLNSEGLIEWENTIGGDETDRCYVVKQVEDSGFVMAGWSDSGFFADKTEVHIGNGDYWVIKLLPEDCTLSTYYADADEDGYGDPIISVSACAPPIGYLLDSTDCDDSNPDINPDVSEVCNDLDDNCNTIIDEELTFFTYYYDVDADEYGNVEETILSCFDIPPDGYVIDSTDCDDTNDLIQHPIAYYADLDGDLFGNLFDSQLVCDLSPPSGYLIDSSDCNDMNSDINPSSIEICNEIDDNCNDDIDEDLLHYTYYIDEDEDNYGNAENSVTDCYGVIPTGYVIDSTDCNDSNPMIYPGALEVNNDIDDNCNDDIDEGFNAILYYPENILHVFPSPNNGNFKIVSYRSDLSEINIKIYTSTGAEIAFNKSQFNEVIYIKLLEKYAGVINITITTDSITISKLIFIF